MRDAEQKKSPRDKGRMSKHILPKLSLRSDKQTTNNYEPTKEPTRCLTKQSQIRSQNVATSNQTEPTVMPCKAMS